MSKSDKLIYTQSYVTYQQQTQLFLFNIFNYGAHD